MKFANTQVTLTRTTRTSTTATAPMSLHITAMRRLRTSIRITHILAIMGMHKQPRLRSPTHMAAACIRTYRRARSTTR